jgi:hypothetical protein
VRTGNNDEGRCEVTAASKLYVGTRGKHGGAATVIVIERNGPRYPLRHAVRHSPDGFQWGYGGSGPAELARCILLDFCQPPVRCRACGSTESEVAHPVRCVDGGEHVFEKDVLPVNYQEFKREFIEPVQSDRLFIEGRKIAAWLESKGVSEPWLATAF